MADKEESAELEPGTYNTWQGSVTWLSTAGAAPQPSVYTMNYPPVTWWPQPQVNWYYPVTSVQAAPGWLCPGCGQGYSPAVAACWHCVPKPPAPPAEGEAPDGNV